MALMTDSSTPIISITLSPPPSPDPSSTSDAEDAYNTAEARIHFGPWKSPEKRVAAMVSRSNSLHPAVHSSPLRRSPRLSTPQPQSHLLENRRNPSQEETNGMTVEEEEEEEEEIIDIPLSRAETPDVEPTLLQDEPSSALAIKISRAHDNPSPPPSPPTDLGLTGLVFPSPRPFLPPSLTASLLNSNDTSNTGDTTPSTPFNMTTGLSNNFSSATPTTSSNSWKASPSDLISFESFSSPAPVFRPISPSIPVPQHSPSSDKPSMDSQASHPLNLLSSSKTDEIQEILTPIPPAVASQSSHVRDEPEEITNIEAVLYHDETQSDLLSALVSMENETQTKAQPPSSSHLDDFLQMPTPRSSHYSVTRHRDHDPRLPQTRQKSAVQMYPQPISDQIEEDEKTNVNLDNRGTEGGKKINSPPQSTSFRELGSLSPTSNDLLSSLITPSQQPSSFSLTIPETKEGSSSTRRPFPQSSPFPALPQTPRRSNSPIRNAGPLRLAAGESSNTQLQRTISSNKPVCTPARRILIEDAIAQGHISPLKGSQLLTSSSRVGFDGKPSLTISSTDSPARRVLALPEVAAPGVPKKWKGIRFGSPTRASSKERHNPVELVSGASEGKSPERSGSVPPSTGTSSSLLRPPASNLYLTETSKPAKLPFPLVLSSKDAAPTIPEERQAIIDLTSTSPTKPSQGTFSSPSKSTLKQTTSRIPTRTVKPYAKPHSKLAIDKGKSTARPPMPTTDSNKYEAISDRALPTYRTDGKVKALSTADKPEFSSLKRKRAVVEIPSPVKPRSTATMRQVPCVVVPNPKARALLTTTVLKKPQHIRRVIDKPTDVTTNLPIPQRMTSTSLSGMTPQTQTGAPTLEREPDRGTSVPEEPSDEEISASSEPIGEVPPLRPASPDGVRRTTRVRKVLNPSLISDTLVPTDVKPRRKPSAQTNGRGDITYTGMSATALRALTTSNTVRNQRYLAAKLETEIIRREGDRPESPVVKIKTVLQREQEEKKRQRKERASRRARQSGGNAGHMIDENIHSDGDTENESDWDDQSTSPSPKRHKRGSGDEEEYKTPIRKLKRLQLVDGDDKEESMENERRVKWDRGLFTTISLDQVKLGTRCPPKESIAIKGCLAPGAKTLPLDNLGNLPYADTPLTDLVEENIVVKKFVYDNDAEVLEEVVVKNTRARSKKGKN